MKQTSPALDEARPLDHTRRLLEEADDEGSGSESPAGDSVGDVKEEEEDADWRERLRDKHDKLWLLRKKEAERTATRQACFQNWKPSCRKVMEVDSLRRCNPILTAIRRHCHRVCQWHIKTGRMKDPNPAPPPEEAGTDEESEEGSELGAAPWARS
jgi:hypothetical protein